MTDFLEKHLTNLKLNKQNTETEPTMDVEIFLIIFVVALMILVILSFVFFLVASRCHKRKEEQYCTTSASLEHLRFSPAERDAHRIRTSTPTNLELATYENFIGSRCNNYLGLFYSEYTNPFDAVDSTVQMTESEKSRNLFQTFTNKNEPKYIYWETRV